MEKNTQKKRKKKRAFITGITGQDGSYLAELLIGKGYETYGLMRRSSTDPLERIQHLVTAGSLHLHYGNLRDLNALRRAMEKVLPDEVYNLAALSDVRISFACPEETMEVNYYGVGRVLNEALRVNPKMKLYQASTSEMFGNAAPPQNEQSPFEPESPYAEAKVKAHEDFIVGYRDKHHAFACSGILFNHESPRRGKHFVTRKITHSLARVAAGLQESVRLGNLDAKRDWGFAGDYVEAMWLMLQQKKPDDYVISTGESHSVREFATAAARALGIDITWHGSGLEEKGVDQNGKTIVSVDKKYYRPREVRFLQGDSAKARKELGWKQKTSFSELVEMMVRHDFAEVNATKNLRH